MDETCLRTEAVYIEDGRVRGRGTKEEMLALKKKDTVCTDLEGRTLMPAFIDGHSHFTGLANSLSQCDLSEAKNFDDIIEKMRAFLKENNIPKGEWVAGANYDHNFLEEKQHPNRRVLDQISAEHPIVIVHASSHMGAANSLAFKCQGISEEVSDPEGGHYGRDGEGRLNGYMEENAFIGFQNSLPMIPVERLFALMQKAQEIYASYGITTVQEGMVTKPLFQLLKTAADQKLLYLDLAAYLDLETCKDMPAQYPEYQKQYRNRLKIGGFKIFLDGSPQGRTAWMKEPYENASDGYRGYPIKTDEHLYRLILEALRQGQQLLSHCNGDAAAEQLVNQFERVHKDYPLYALNRPVMIHAQLVAEEELRRMKELSMSPSFFTAHTYYWGDIHIENFGMSRAENISPAKTALRLGLPFTFHQDSPVLPPDIFRTLWCAEERVTRKGVRLNPKESISIYEGLKAMTRNGALQYFEEDSKGSIEPGKLADFVILDRNPLEIPAEEVKDIRVMKTFKEGNCVYSREQR